MADLDPIALITATEGFVTLVLLAFNAYFLSRRPIFHFIREIYFINARRFREAWYLIISATTFFVLERIVAFLGPQWLPVSPDQAQGLSTIFGLAFGTLAILSFSLVFAVFVRYVHTVPSPAEEVIQRISKDLRRSVSDLDQDLDLRLESVSDVLSQRRQLGPHVSLSHYRAITNGVITYMEHKIGHLGDAILYAVGRLTGRRAAREVLAVQVDRQVAMGQILLEIRENGIAIPEVRQSTPDGVDVVLYENAPAAGIQPRGKAICHYQAGLLAGIYEAMGDRATLATEVKCWGLGDRFCEFHIDLGASTAHQKTKTST